MICRWFLIEELVPPDVHEILGDMAWRLFDEDMLVTIDAIRDDFGPIVINDWHNKGAYRYSGFRGQNCKIGAKYSWHKAGGAFDIKPKESPLGAVYDAIRAGNYPAVRRVENIEKTPTWIHIDNKPHDHGGVYVFDP